MKCRDSQGAKLRLGLGMSDHDGELGEGRPLNRRSRLGTRRGRGTRPAPLEETGRQSPSSAPGCVSSWVFRVNSKTSTGKLFQSQDGDLFLFPGQTQRQALYAASSVGLSEVARTLGPAPLTRPIGTEQTPVTRTDRL